MIFKELSDYPGYFACSDGWVYSSWRQTKDSSYIDYSVKHKLKPGLRGKKKYYLICPKNIDGKPTTKDIHSLIASAFLGPKPEGMTVSHKDGNSKNNKPENLVYETYSDNHKRKIEHGTYDGGTKNSRAIFSLEDLQTMLSLRNQNWTHKQIADHLNTDSRNIQRILAGQRYAREIQSLNSV